mgnify:CR=1 FL=1
MTDLDSHDTAIATSTHSDHQHKSLLFWSSHPPTRTSTRSPGDSPRQAGRCRAPSSTVRTRGMRDLLTTAQASRSPREFVTFVNREGADTHTVASTGTVRIDRTWTPTTVSTNL